MRKEEMETILRFDTLDNCWYAYSTVQRHINAMKKKGWILLSELDDEASFKAPVHSVKISNVNKKSITNEQLEDMRKRMKTAREAKKLNKTIE